MSREDQLKKLNSGNYKYQNPYTQPDKPASKPQSAQQPYRTPEVDLGGLDKHGYLHGRIADMQRQIDMHQFDIVTIMQIIMDENDPSELLDIRDLRQAYSNFRADKRHVLNRIEGKIELINNFKMKLNEDKADV